MSEAMKLILEFGFKKLKLRRIYARAYEPTRGLPDCSGGLILNLKEKLEST